MCKVNYLLIEERLPTTCTSSRQFVAITASQRKQLVVSADMATLPQKSSDCFGAGYSNECGTVTNNYGFLQLKILAIKFG
ncbi:hypothetical protein J6590_009312 [Homalodisca vitripennis]|nr:hypothetical protein J6590_009312 [Homalodisca vitripennis]